MRWRKTLLLLLILAGLVAAAGHFLLGWWQPTHRVVTENLSDYTDQSEPATLDNILVSARKWLGDMEENIHDYSATLVKRERIGETLVEKKMFIKFREKPFSVYLKFLDVSNEDVKGREVMYVDGRNGNKLQVHTPGMLTGAFTIPLPPKGLLAMHGEHYPITEIGIANLCRQLIQRGEAIADPSQAKVRRFPHAHVQNRPCTLLEVTYPINEKGFRGYLVHIFVDDEMHVPLCVRVYGLPAKVEMEPQIVEEYTYLDLKINNGYTDADFDLKNRQYKFP